MAISVTSHHHDLHRSGASAYRPTQKDVEFLQTLRRLLTLEKIRESDRADLDESFSGTTFPQEYNRIGIIVYQATQKRLVVVRRRAGAYENISKVVDRVRKHPRFDCFEFADAKKCRIQIDFVVESPAPIDITDLVENKVDPNRFEMGIDGLRITDGERTHYFFPGDAFVKSIMSLGQLRRYLTRMVQSSDLSSATFQKFRSKSYVSYENHWVRLYRGYPVVQDFSKDALCEAVKAALQHIMKYQSDDGRFLYYYDASNDSRRDFQHPTRDPGKNPYYNILRHAGGALIYLFHYRNSNDHSVLPYTRRAIDFLVDQIIVYETDDGREAGYVYFNRKAKLGGSGIALYLLSEFQNLTGDDTYSRWATLLANHILSQITASGEFIYYYLYLDKQITQQENQDYFSFYYPGEAIIGLATYYKHACREADERTTIRDKLTSALHFLFVDRPRTREDHYTALPSDSWLMMAVCELWDIPEMQDPLYKDQVFHDADVMVGKMYNAENALYPDYAGAFYYKYGDYPYADGARCEGLLGAYELAVKLSDRKRIAKYGAALKLAALATLRLTNTAQSTYSVPNPEKSVGGIRFKYTRQWFRIDTIQHVAAFYLKFLPHLDD